MWKRRVSVFLIVCLLCGLIPAHAADVPGHPDMGSMPVWEETEPSESTPMPEAEAGPEQVSQSEDADAAGTSAPAQQDNSTFFEVRSESDLKAAINNVNSGESGTYTISLLEDIQAAGSEQGALKIKQNRAVLLGNGHTLTYAPNADSRGGLGAEGQGTLVLGKEDGSDRLTITSTGSQVTPLVDSMRGGTVDMYPGVTLTGNQYNGGRFGGGVDVGKNGTFNMYGGTISGCSTGLLEHGGGVGMVEEGAVFNLRGGVIERNRAAKNGGGIYVTNGAFHMSGGTIQNNEAGLTGGGLYLSGVPVHITGGTISGNSAGSYGGGLYVSGKKITHGAIGFNPTVDPWEEVEIVIPMGGRSRRNSGDPQGISGVSITGNKAGEAPAHGTGQGGGLLISACPGLTLSGLTVSQNTLTGGSATGGGICIDSSNNVTISNSIISGNRGGFNGAGVHLYNSPDATLDRCRILQNVGGPSCQGGGLCARESANIQIIDSEITGNTAGFCGGGVALTYNSTGTLDRCTVTGNSSKTGGGVAVALSTSMTVHDQTVLCNNTASVEGADVSARAPQYGYKSSITLPEAAGMNQTYLADSQGIRIDGWYQDAEGSRYTPAEDGDPVSVDSPIESGAALVASYRILPGHTLTYDVNGGTAGSGPVPEANLRPGAHQLSTVRPTHAPDNGKAVVFAGWSAVQDQTIYSKGDESFDPSTLLTAVVMAQADQTVYAVWGYDENGNGTADILELPDIIEVLPKDPAQPFLPENQDDVNNSQTTPAGYVRVIFEAGDGGTFGTYDDQTTKIKLAYDVKDSLTWGALTVPIPIEKPGYVLKSGSGRWSPALPARADTVVSNTYTAQYTKLPQNMTLWYHEVHLQRADGSYTRWTHGQAGRARIGSTVSINEQKYDGQTAWGAALGQEYVFYAEHPENRLSARAEDAGRMNPLKIYYRRAPHTVTYQYEGALPEGAPTAPGMVNTWYGASVQIAESPVLDGYAFSGWTPDPASAVVANGILTMPHADVVLKGLWVEAATVTFRVVNGTWSDGTAADRQATVLLTGGSGTLDTAAVPTGMQAASGYTGGAWDAEPDTGAGAITGSMTYTYTFQQETPDPVQTLLHPTMGIMIEGQRIDVPHEGPIGSNANLPEQFRPIAVTLGTVRRSFDSGTVGAPNKPLSLKFTDYPNSTFTEGSYPVVVENLPQGYAYEILMGGAPVQSPIQLTDPLPNIMLNIRKTYTLIYDANGGNGDGPAAQTGLLPGNCTLSDTGPTHSPMDGKAVVWIGWTAEQDTTVYGKGNTAFDPSKLLNHVTITNRDETVYALWGYDENGNGSADVLDQTATVTFHISNGTWADGSASDLQVLVLLHNGKGTLAAANVPTGMKADSGYTGGAWDRQPDTAPDAITGNTVYTYSFRKSGGSGGIGGNGGGTTRYTLSYESNGGTKYKDERYAAGTTVKLDKAPQREGYVFTGWYSDKKLTETIKKVTMNRNKTIYAGWEKEAPAHQLHIPDMLNGDDHIAYIAGYTDGTVGPNNKITRAEVAMIFYRLLKDDVRAANETSQNSFTDVTEGMWHNTAISTIARLGIVVGRSRGIYDPNAPITRGEFATICARFDHSKIEESGHFSDIEGHWARHFIQRAAALGWVSGYTDGTFRPNAHITRAEAMAMINRVLGRLPETAEDLLPGMKTWPDNADPNAWYYLTVQEATNSHSFERKPDGVHERWTGLRNGK